MTEPITKGRLSRLLVAPALVGALVGGFGIAAAQTGGPSTTSTPSTTITEDSSGTGTAAAEDGATTTTAAPAPSGSTATSVPVAGNGDAAARRGGRGSGSGETLLTGETAEKVKAAALKAVPGGTVDRVETDSDGSPYEAHVTKADGTRVTVKVNEAFEVTSIEEDGGHHGGRGPGGGENVLTGETAEKVTAAAQQAVPGGTVDRVQANRDGEGYHAHVTKADGTHVRVNVNEAFEVTSVEDEPARPPRA